MADAQAKMISEEGSPIQEVSLFIDSPNRHPMRVDFQRDGAGVIVTVREAWGETIAWDRISSTVCDWLRDVIS